MVISSNSNDFLWSKRSISLSKLLTGDSVDELKGVGVRRGSFPFGSKEGDFTGVGNEDEICME